MIEVIKRGTKATGAVRFSIGRESSGTGASSVPAHALANPFKLTPYGSYTRNESITAYEAWLTQKVRARNPDVCTALNDIWRAVKRGEVELECFCAPLPCHGDVIKRVVEAKLA